MGIIFGTEVRSQTVDEAPAIRGQAMFICFVGIYMFFLAMHKLASKFVTPELTS